MYPPVPAVSVSPQVERSVVPRVVPSVKWFVSVVVAPSVVPVPVV